MNRIVSIQLLRALACLLVLMVHMNMHNAITANALNGAIGVNVFFVISGYIIAASIGRLPEQGATKTFLINRFTRVGPYYYLLTLALAVTAWFKSGLLPTAQDVLASFLFVPRIGYDPVLELGWSLNHEVYFYLFVGLAAAFTRRVLWIAAAFAGLLLVLQLVPQPTGLLRAWGASINMEFLFGMLIYHFRDKVQTLFRHPAWAVLFLLALLPVMRETMDIPINAQFKAIDPALAYLRDTIFLYHAPFTLPRGLAYGLPAAAVFMAVLAQEPRLHRLSQKNLLVKIGDASFTLYLIQAIFLLLLIGNASLWLVLLISVACVCAALLIYPLENHLARLTKKLFT